MMKFQVVTALLLATASDLAEAQGLIVPTSFLEAAEATGNYTTLLGLVEQTGFEDLMAPYYPITFLGPNDEAFAAIQSTLDTLTEEEVVGVLAGHVVLGEIRLFGIMAYGCIEVETLAITMPETLGQTMVKLSHNTTDGSVMVNDATVVQPDLGDEFFSGVLHGVDAVILTGYSTPCPVNFVDAADETGNYTTLLDSVPLDVVDTYIANYPVTLFGPTNAAFAAIADTLDTLTEEEVADVFLGHAVAGEYRAQAVIDAGCVELETLAGTMLKVSYNTTDGSVMVNDASTVVQPDLGDEGSIGVLHGVDAVILGGFTPCPVVTFVDAAAATGDYDTLLQLVNDTPGVVDAITENVPVTVFGPTDDAFAAIQSTLDTLTEDQVASTLAGHVVAGEYRAQDVIDAGCVELTTLAGTMLKVTYSEDDGVMVNSVATVVDPDLGDEDTIGVLHGVDAVILGGFTPCASSSPSTSPSASTSTSPSASTSTSPSTAPTNAPTAAPTAAPTEETTEETTAAPTTSSAAGFTAAIGFLVSLLAGFVVVIV